MSTYFIHCLFVHSQFLHSAAVAPSVGAAHRRGTKLRPGDIWAGNPPESGRRSAEPRGVLGPGEPGGLSQPSDRGSVPLEPRGPISQPGCAHRAAAGGVGAGRESPGTPGRARSPPAGPQRHRARRHVQRALRGHAPRHAPITPPPRPHHAPLTPPLPPLIGRPSPARDPLSPPLPPHPLSIGTQPARGALPLVGPPRPPRRDWPRWGRARGDGWEGRGALKAPRRGRAGRPWPTRAWRRSTWGCPRSPGPTPPPACSPPPPW